MNKNNWVEDVNSELIVTQSRFHDKDHAIPVIITEKEWEEFVKNQKPLKSN